MDSNTESLAKQIEILHNPRSVCQGPALRVGCKRNVPDHRGEKALGPEDPDGATSLESYAVLLRKNARQAEAARLETWAKSIPAKRR